MDKEKSLIHLICVQVKLWSLMEEEVYKNAKLIPVFPHKVKQRSEKQAVEPVDEPEQPSH